MEGKQEDAGEQGSQNWKLHCSMISLSPEPWETTQGEPQNKWEAYREICVQAAPSTSAGEAPTPLGWIQGSSNGFSTWSPIHYYQDLFKSGGWNPHRAVLPTGSCSSSRIALQTSQNPQFWVAEKWEHKFSLPLFSPNSYSKGSPNSASFPTCLKSAVRTWQLWDLGCFLVPPNFLFKFQHAEDESTE